MAKKVALFIIVAIVIFVLDQLIKGIFIDGYRFSSQCLDLTLVYNKGVAFSMFEFLDEWLKYIQIILLMGLFGYLIYSKEYELFLPFGILFGSAASNIYDRFIHGGVVDMVHWHCGFEFAIFNFADVMIDVAVVWIVAISWLSPKKCKAN